MTLSVAGFTNRWKINSQSEKAGAQSHFIDLCDVLGEPHPAAGDSAGERYAFEKPVSKTFHLRVLSIFHLKSPIKCCVLL